MYKNLQNIQKGFTIFFAILLGSLALAVGLAIYDLTAREIDLSAAASQSQYAIYAADSGSECALYWDNKAPSLNGSPSVFATSTWTSNNNQSPPTSGVTCNGEDITTQGPPAVDLARYTGCNATTPWCITNTTSAATTTFLLTIQNGGSPLLTFCAIVQVAKYTDANNILYTTVISRGYNNCGSGSPARIERTLQVSY